MSNHKKEEEEMFDKVRDHDHFSGKLKEPLILDAILKKENVLNFYQYIFIILNLI